MLRAVWVFKLLSHNLAFQVLPAKFQFVVQLEKMKLCCIVFNNMPSTTSTILRE